MKRVFIILLLAIVAIVLFVLLYSNHDMPKIVENLISKDIVENRIDFIAQNPIFRFSAVLPDNFKIEYIPEIGSINIYDPNSNQESLIDKSQIFIRYFKASSFLTLSTVDILDQEHTSIKGHQAVSYEIKKKENVSNFPYQPFWRNQQHRLIDIRFNSEEPTLFYVFSHSPEMNQEKFNTFINSLIFHNN